MTIRYPLPSQAVTVAHQAAEIAGRHIVTSLGRPRRVSRKSSAIDLVTEVDRRVERAIQRRIHQTFPDHGFVGEESPRIQGGSPYQWIVDPIDGTTNFIHGLPHCSVSIALTCHDQILLGVVFDPSRCERFTARAGRGAQLNGKRLGVSAIDRLQDSLLGTGFPTDIWIRPSRHFRLFEQFQLRTHAVRRIGSAALNLAYVAAGRFDGIWEDNVSSWDSAAGLLLVTEAGGRVTDFKGHPATHHTRDIVASNGRIHAAMMRYIKPRTRKHRR